ncbi:MULTISPECIES: GNAT family N-acetyltransferase [unclassified Streptomyces]|uniref:GNAT family N-acetyltransferase n=1 Tax=unclassified Streptomyces TaxID=2593676 RepID=UPI0036E7AF48
MEPAEKYAVRPVRAEEWEAVRELRLASLRDPVAPIAFLETYEDAVARPDEFWRERAGRFELDGSARQFVAEGADGLWWGAVTVRVEGPGETLMFGDPGEVRQAHLVGVYVRPGYRGSGVTEALFLAAVEWARSLAGLERVRLYVHEDNARAQGFYRRFGFVRSGESLAVPGDPGKCEYEMVLEGQ